MAILSSMIIMQTDGDTVDLGLITALVTLVLTTGEISSPTSQSTSTSSPTPTSTSAKS